MRNIHFVEGVNIIAKHMPNGCKPLFDLFASGGKFSFGQVEWINSSEDLKRLKELEWFKEDGMWTCEI